MLKPSLCIYSDTYTFFKVTITVSSRARPGTPANNGNKKSI